MGRSQDATLLTTGGDQKRGAVALLPSSDDLRDLVLALQHSRKQLAWMEFAATRCIQQASEAFGKDAFLVHQEQWSSHAAALKDWDDGLADDLKRLRSCSVAEGEKTLVDAPEESPVRTAEHAEAPDGNEKEAAEGKADVVPTVPVAKQSNVATVTSWAAKFKASLSPNQLGGVGKPCPREHASSKMTKPKPVDRTASPVAATGIVSKLMKSSGYGFLAPHGGGGSIFFHAKSCNIAFDALKEGEEASFLISTDSSGRRVATRVQFSQPSPAALVPAAAPKPAALPGAHTVKAGKSAVWPVLPAQNGKATKPAAKPDANTVAKPAAKPKTTLSGKSTSQSKVATSAPAPATKEQRDLQKIDVQGMPPLREGEVELLIDDPLTCLPVSQVRSDSVKVKNFRFNILAFPNGTKTHAGKCLGAFVEAVPGDVEPDCVFKDVKFEITVVNWADFGKSLTKSDTFAFKAAGLEIDRGWHDLLTIAQLKAGSSWVGPAGSVCIRARCTVAKTANWK